jgi:prephenate dehydrogenase
MIDYAETSQYIIKYDKDTDKFHWVIDEINMKSCCFDRASEAIEDVTTFIAKHPIESK